MKMDKVMKCNTIMNNIYELLHKKIIGFYEEHEMNSVNIEILNILDAKEKVTLYETVRIISKPTSNISPTLRKLAVKGLLTKIVSQSDRRIVYFTISKKGKEALGASKKFFDELAEQLVSDETLLDNVYSSLDICIYDEKEYLKYKDR